MPEQRAWGFGTQANRLRHTGLTHHVTSPLKPKFEPESPLDSPPTQTYIL